MWMAVGSQHEPIYPDCHGCAVALSSNISDLGTIDTPSATDSAKNGLRRVVEKYAGRIVAVEANPSDMVFFAGHTGHWSLANNAKVPRGSFVGHFCNARSQVLWNLGQTREGDSPNFPIF